MGDIINIDSEEKKLKPGEKTEEVIEVDLSRIGELDRIEIEAPPEIDTIEEIETINDENKIILRLKKSFITNPSYRFSTVEFKLYNMKKGIREKEILNIKYIEKPSNL